MNAFAYASLRTLAVAAIATVIVPTAAQAQPRPAERRVEQALRVSTEAYRRGYEDGLRRGEQDGRRGRRDDLSRHDLGRDRSYRDADRGYDRRFGNRTAFQNAFRRGYAEGYRSGYERTSRVGRGNNGRAAFRDPAQARGYSDGYDRGFDDGEDRDRFDPFREGDYRDADNGYQGSYGSRAAYRDNYRTGFSVGYEDGYRDGRRRNR